MHAARIMICPLDWGLGHAARCVPVIRALKAAGAVPVIAADRGPLALLRKEFPSDEFIRFPGVTVRYPANGKHMAWSMLKQSPKLLLGIREETRFVERSVKELGIDAVISDNRFGAYANGIPSVYISHQVHIQTGNAFTDALARRRHARYMRRFDEVWIPDAEGPDNLSGKLSHGKHVPGHASYIGPLSRFTEIPAGEKRYDAALILSGPEPQRSLLEADFLTQTKAFPGLKFLLVRGTDEVLGSLPENVDQIPLTDHESIRRICGETRHLICRSGYTSIMELAVAGRSAHLIPTPGQTEQIYLAAYLDGKYGFRSVAQERFSLAEILPEEIVFQDCFSFVGKGAESAVERLMEWV